MKSSDEVQRIKTKFGEILKEVDQNIEFCEGLGFDRLCSRLKESQLEVTETVPVETESPKKSDDGGLAEEEEQIKLSKHASKRGISVYSSFYSDDFETKFTKSLPQDNRSSPLLTGNVGSGNLPANTNAQGLSLLDFRSLDVNYNSRKSPRRNLTTSNSILKLSQRSINTSSSSCSFRIVKRKSILINDESPIKIKPSGRHLTFMLPDDYDYYDEVSTPRNKQIPSISPYPENVDPELLIPFIPNPPFVGWLVPYLIQKVKFSPIPNISFVMKSPKIQLNIFNFHLPPIKQLIEESTKEKDIQLEIIVDDNDIENDKKSKKKKSRIHFRKKKKEQKQKEEKPKKKSWFRKSEMDKKSAAVIKEINSTLRKCWKNLNNAKNKNDQFGRLQNVSEWYQIIYSYIPTLVNYSKDFPNNEFIVDAIREYEHIRVEFDQTLNEIEFIKGQTMVENIQQSAKQLSMILVSLDIYINNENVNSKPKIAAASKVMGYLTNILYNLQIIVDCPDPSSYIASSEFIFNLWNAIKQFDPIFSELEFYVQKSILEFAVKSILLTLKPAIVILHEINNNLFKDKNELFTNPKFVFSDEQINEQITFIRKVSSEFLKNPLIAKNDKLYVTMISDLFEELVNLPNISNPLFVTDLNKLGDVIEATFIEMQNQDDSIKDIYNNEDSNKTLDKVILEYKKETLTSPELEMCLTVLAAIRRLQFMLTVKLGEEFHSIIEDKKEDDDAINDESSSKETNHANISYDSELSVPPEQTKIMNIEFIRLVTQNESDFSELGDLIQISSTLSESYSLQSMTKNWFDSIYQITYAFIDLLKVAPILNKQPFLYSQVDSYYDLLLDTFQFFKNTAKAKINVSSILDHLIANIKCTKRYSELKPFGILPDLDKNKLVDDGNKKKKKSKKKDNFDRFINFPLFEQQFDFEKYKCGFIVNRIPLYKKALFSDFILVIISKLREPHPVPQKTMDYLVSLYTQIFTSIINISVELQKAKEKEKEELKKKSKPETEHKSKGKQKSKDKGKSKDKENSKYNESNSDPKDYFLLLLIGKERDFIYRQHYFDSKSCFYYGLENKLRLIFLLSLGDFLAKFAELASILSDDSQITEELLRKSQKKKKRKKRKSNERKRRNRIGEEFKIEGLTDNDSKSSKSSDSENCNNNNDNDYSNSENENEYDNENCEESKNQSSDISKEAKNKLKELRQNCKVCISNLKKFSKKLSKPIIQSFNLVLRAKPSTVKDLIISSEEVSKALVYVLEDIKADLKVEREFQYKNMEDDVLFVDDNIGLNEGSNSSSVPNSIIISKNESSYSIDDSENDLSFLEIKDSFDTIISSALSINKSNEEEEEEEEEEEDETVFEIGFDGDDDIFTAGVFFEQIYKEIAKIPEILESPYYVAARHFSKICKKISKYSKKSLHVPYSETLTLNLIDQFIALVRTARNRYLHYYRSQLKNGRSIANRKSSNDSKDDTKNDKDNKEDTKDEEEEKNEDEDSVNFIFNERVNNDYTAISLTAKLLLQRELIENSDDTQLLLMILSQKLTEQASNLHSSSDDYSFVLDVIKDLSVAVINAYKGAATSNAKNKKNESLSFESLKMFVASFDYFIETFVKEMDNEILSDEMILVIHQFEKLPMKIPGYYGPKLSLRFLLIEADNEEEND